MAYTASVIEVMIASPGDVDQEREVIREVLSDWNRLHSRSRSVVLLPLGWDTHSAPDLGGRAQDLINERILEKSDLLVGIFGLRVGTPTGKSISGSIEEIQRHHEAGKPVMLYFSNAPLPRDHDRDQLNKVEEFKRWAFERGLVGSFTTPEGLRKTFSDELQINLRDVPYLDAIMRAASHESRAPETTARALSDDAMNLMRLAAADDQGLIMLYETMDGLHVSAGRQEVSSAEGHREAARWKDAVRELQSNGYVQPKGVKGEIFELTRAAYALIDGEDA